MPNPRAGAWLRPASNHPGRPANHPAGLSLPGVALQTSESRLWITLRIIALLPAALLLACGGGGSADPGSAATPTQPVAPPPAAAVITYVPSPALIGPTHRVLVLYDEPQGLALQRLGKAYAIMLRNLIGHWNPEVELQPVEQYSAGQLEKYDATMYIGSYFRGATPALLLPAALLADIDKTRKTFVWFKNNLDQLRRVQGLTLSQRFGFEFDFVRGVLGDPAAPVPDFFDNVVYKGRELRKYYQYSNGQIFGDPDIGFTRITDAARAKVIAPIRNSAYARFGQTVEAPYIIRADNFWYVADVPMSYIGPRDRYLAFSDVLHDMLGESPDKGQRALVRFEDVGALVNPDHMRAITDLLWPATGRRIPYAMAVIPHHLDPKGTFNRGVPLDLPLAQATRLRQAVDYALTRGGSVVMHGVTHQFGNRANLYDAVSGADFEFWDARLVAPLPGDDVAFWRTRLESGRSEMLAAGYAPFAFETPHYQGSPAAYRAIAEVFGTVYERSVYYTAEQPALQAVGAQRDFAVSQFFPYVIARDYYGRRVIPENLGNIQYDARAMDTGSVSTYTWEDLKLNAEIVKAVVRNGFASFFFHPLLLGTVTQSDGTVSQGDGLGDLGRIVNTITDLGFTWTDPQSLK